MVGSKKFVGAKQSSKREKPPLKQTRTELLLEIGTEELPYQCVAPTLQFLKDHTKLLLDEFRLSHGTITTIGTPRRVVVSVADLAKRQTAFLQETFGPPKTAAFSADGTPTKAAIGFAKSQQMNVEDLEVRQTPKGEYLCATKQEKGKYAYAVMERLLTTLIESIGFPKSMRWNHTGMRFARPIRWILALCDNRVVPLSIGGVKAGGQTQGHRFLSKGGTRQGQGLSIKNFENYLKVLSRHMVLADHRQREQAIEHQLQTLAKTVQGQVAIDSDLMEQAVHMVEWPHAIVGSFDKGYLALPGEVLMTSMKEHQGFFPLTKKDGTLLPKFISVTNMKLKNMDVIREGNERVLSARLADAKFFFDEDQKIKLEDRVTQLHHMAFHQKLGNLHQKSERVRELAAQVLKQQGSVEKKPSLQRAAYLCKADLLTGMVGEFPTLQGLMGGAYARLEGEEEETCLAIRDHYLPKGMEDSIPASLLGKLLSIADRLDTLGAFFHVKMIPSGSEDPFGLRRHATAIVRIVIEGNLRLDLRPLIDQAFHSLEKEGYTTPSAPRAQTNVSPPESLIEFILERVRHYGRTIHAFREDVMNAVLDSTVMQKVDLVDTLARMKALQTMTTFEEFDPLMIGFKRAHRLISKEEWVRDGVQPSLFSDQSEHQLFQEVQKAGAHLPQLLSKGEYPQSLSLLVTLKPSIDDFFTKVMVNDTRPDVRANRLTLLEEVANVFMAFANFSQIHVAKN